MFKLRHKICAFSLIELMVAIAISSVIFYAAYLIMSSSSEAYQLTTRNLKLQYEARKAANTIVSDLRQSNTNNIKPLFIC